VQSIAANGYQMIYLTARGIGMATTTKEYLKSIRQGGANLALPDAPVLLSPTRLIESLTREVIRRNPEEFKIECLNKIRSLWPEVRSRHGGSTDDWHAALPTQALESRGRLYPPHGTHPPRAR
jgi:phosphatidate phosphatase LPIN